MILKYTSIMIVSFVVLFSAVNAAESKKDEKSDNEVNEEKYELTEECITSYREVREELYNLQSCKKTSDCEVAFFVFPFGPETCKFYGVNTPEGKKNKKIVESNISKFTEECSKDKPDYQSWLKVTGGKFKVKKQDCVDGEMFAECIEGSCVTKFGYDINNRTPKITGSPI